MKWRILFILAITIFCIVIFLPFSIAFLMKREMLQFVSGEIDSWILFWGSYVGAIIGSIVVYVVAKIQMKKQHEQQIQEIKRESGILSQLDIEGYLLRNKINKLDAMAIAADELYLKLEDIREDIYPQMSMFFEDSMNFLDINEEEKEEKYNFLFETITKNIKQGSLLIRKLRTLSSYVPEMKEDLNEIETLFIELEKDIAAVFNVKDGFKRFMKSSDLDFTITYEIPSFELLYKKLPKFIVYKLRAELTKSIKEVSVLARSHITLTK